MLQLCNITNDDNDDDDDDENLSLLAAQAFAAVANHCIPDICLVMIFNLWCSFCVLLFIMCKSNYLPWLGTLYGTRTTGFSYY